MSFVQRGIAAQAAVDRYQAINYRTYPRVTMREILPFYVRLVTRFGKASEIPVGVLEARGGRDIKTNRTRARRVWSTSQAHSTGHDNGWGRMIHDASHYVFERRHPKARAHDGGHATLEREMADYVRDQGWVARVDRLRDASKPVKLTASDKVERKRAALARWQAKQRRAANAIKKLNRQLRALERKL